MVPPTLKNAIHGRRIGLGITCFLLAVLPLCAQPSISAVLNGASYSGTLSPGCWAALWGSKLATSTVTAASVPLPALLGNVSVSVAGIAAPLLFVSANQINFLIPFEVAIPGNSVAPVTVTTAEGTSAAFNIRLGRNSPGVFTLGGNGLGKAIVFNANYQPLDTIPPNAPVIFYAAGLGPTNPPATSSAGGAMTEPFNRVVDNLEVYIGEARAEILFAGLAPGFPGIYQINVMPKGAASDRLFVRSGAWQSNVAEAGALAGENVANVAGSIEGLYPPTKPNTAPFNIPTMTNPVGQSVMFLGGYFAVSFDIRTDAKPFTVAATGEAGSATINFNPSKGTYDAVVAIPAMAPRFGDFSTSEFTPLLDFYTCNKALCIPFPGSIIPRSRLDPVYLAATNLLPTPNTPVPVGSATGTLISSGLAPAGSRFVIDNDTHSELSRFGGFLQISPAGARTRAAAFKLYVDGKLVASRDAAYDVQQ